MTLLHKVKILAAADKLLLSKTQKDDCKMTIARCAYIVTSSDVILQADTKQVTHWRAQLIPYLHKVNYYQHRLQAVDWAKRLILNDSNGGWDLSWRDKLQLKRDGSEQAFSPQEMLAKRLQALKEKTLMVQKKLEEAQAKV